MSFMIIMYVQNIVIYRDCTVSRIVKAMELTYYQNIEGTKEEFYKLLEQYTAFQDYKGEERFRWYRDARFQMVKRADIIYLWDHKTNSISLGFIKIFETPSKRIRLTVHLDRRYYDESLRAWSLLREELVKADFIIGEVKKKPSYQAVEDHTVEELFNKGYTNSQIAAHIYKSESTVKRIKSRLGLRKKNG